MNVPPGYGANANKGAIHVKHADLKRVGESAFRSQCPACNEGLLMVYRESNHPFRLRNVDRCTRCFQVVIYDDDSIANEEVVRDEQDTALLNQHTEMKS